MRTLRNPAATDRENNLPVWAQKLIRDLRHDIAILRHAVEDLPPVDSTAKVVTGRYDATPKRVNAGLNESVTFYPRGYDSPDSYDVRLNGDELYISAYSADSLAVCQSASNTATIFFRRGLREDKIKQRKEALAKGWSSDEIRLNKHLGRIPNRSEVDR